MLSTAEHIVERPSVAAIDYHNHLDSLDPRDVLTIMDACGLERIVNITMQTGEEALAVMRRFHSAAPQRFSTIGWMDWSGIEQPDFFRKSVDSLEQLVEHGACGLKMWKDLGLTVRDASGQLLRIDDERLAPIFEKAAELQVPVMFHTADPDAFFLPTDQYNERFEELAAHPDWSFYGSQYAKQELLEQRNRVFARHPGTTFVAAHMAESAECLSRVAELLDAYPNVSVDMSARVAELGRQPYTARAFFLRYAEPHPVWRGPASRYGNVSSQLSLSGNRRRVLRLSVARIEAGPLARPRPLSAAGCAAENLPRQRLGTTQYCNRTPGAHISLAFREMWDTTALSLQLLEESKLRLIHRANLGHPGPLQFLLSAVGGITHAGQHTSHISEAG